MKDAKYYKSLFMAYFDGCYGVDPTPDTPSTFSMGVCKLEYQSPEGDQVEKLVVHLRRPGLLIGKAGRTIEALEKGIGIKVGIVEVDLLK